MKNLWSCSKRWFCLVLMSRCVSGRSYIVNSENLLSTEPHTWTVTSLVYHQGAMLTPSSQIMTGLFFLFDSSLPSLAVTRETQHIPISIRCGSSVSEPAMSGLWEVSWAPHSLLETRWHLSDSNISCSLFPVWPGWSLSQKCDIQSTCIPLHVYQVYWSFWKDIARQIKEKRKVVYGIYFVFFM